MDMIGQLLTGRYLILEKLGAGGFSQTYLARDKYLPRHPLCVVKCLKPSSNSSISAEAADRLFETEAQVLERLGQQHSQIPTLFAYCREQDQVYLIQEYVDGENLGRWLSRGQRLTSKTAIALLLELLPLLDFLHSHQVIHQDIKPSNLIRRRRDGKVVLIDFGAARLLTETHAEAQSNDADSITVGTPGYMPDEQQLGMPQLNSDLYALGMLVIHLLTGVHPKEFKQDMFSGEMDWQRYLGQQSLDPKLVEILDRMVRVKFSDRYQQASAVLNDLQTLPAAKRSWQFNLVSNCWSSLQRIWLPATAILLIAIMGGRSAPVYGQKAKTWLAQLQERFHHSEMRLSLLREIPIQFDIDRMIIAPNNQVLVTAGSDRVLRLWSLANGTVLKTLYGHSAAITSLAISQDGNLLVSASADGFVYLWNTNTGQPLRSFRAHHHSITTIAISPDSRTFASGCQDGSLRRWDTQTGIRMQTLKLLDGEVTNAIFGTTSDRLISASSDRQLQVWDLRTGQIHQSFAGHTQPVMNLQIADNQTLFSFAKDRGLMWDLKREELEVVFPEKSADTIAASLNHQNLITVHNDGKVRVWLRRSERLVPEDVGILGKNENVAISPNHHYLVSWNSDQRLRVWQIDADSDD